MKIAKNSYVTVDYLIRLGESETFPPDGKPEEISFCLGGGTMPPVLEEAMLGMAVNEHKELHLSPAEAYGEVDAELIMEVPKSDFPANAELKPGLVFETDDEDGHPVYFIIREVKPEAVVIDFNHPLAGREMDVSFTVLKVREATPEELQACSCEHCGPGEAHSH